MKLFPVRIQPDSKFLFGALAFTIICHGTALLATVLFLLPGLPSGDGDVLHRATYISDHVVAWQIGWLPWQVTALSDLILAFALVRTTWIDRNPARASLALTVVAILFEQPAEYRWVTKGVEFAQQAARTKNTAVYSAFESITFHLTSYWAAFFYTLAAIAWSVCFARAGTWNRFLSILSVCLWGLLLVISAGPLVFSAFPTKIVSTGNAIGFNLMMIWFAVVAYLVVARRKPVRTESGID